METTNDKRVGDDGEGDKKQPKKMMKAAEDDKKKDAKKRKRKADAASREQGTGKRTKPDTNAKSETEPKPAAKQTAAVKASAGAAAEKQAEKEAERKEKEKEKEEKERKEREEKEKEVQRLKEIERQKEEEEMEKAKQDLQCVVCFDLPSSLQVYQVSAQLLAPQSFLSVLSFWHICRTPFKSPKPCYILSSLGLLLVNSILTFFLFCRFVYAVSQWPSSLPRLPQTDCGGPQPDLPHMPCEVQPLTTLHQKPVRREGMDIIVGFPILFVSAPIKVTRRSSSLGYCAQHLNGCQ